MYYDHKPGHELDDTTASAADDRLEEILKRIKAGGGKITKDETIPLHIDFNNEVVEIGDRRVIEFSVNRIEFQIIRDTKIMRIGGAGPHKHLEHVARPIIDTKLKKREDNSDQWISVDMEDMF